MNAQRGNTTVMEMQTAVTLTVHSHVSAAVDTMGMDTHAQVSDSDVDKLCNGMKGIQPTKNIP